MSLIHTCIKTLSNLAQVSTYSKNYEQKVLTISFIKQLLYVDTINHTLFTKVDLDNSWLWTKPIDFLKERSRNIISISYGFFENYFIKNDEHNGMYAVLNPYMGTRWTTRNLTLASITPIGYSLINIILYRNSNKVEISKNYIKTHMKLFVYAYGSSYSKLLKFIESIYTVKFLFTVRNKHSNYNDGLITLYINSNTPGIRTQYEFPSDDCLNRPTLKKIRQKNVNKQLLLKEFKQELESLI
jgi:hypothetical protein